MSRISGKETKPEIAIRKRLFLEGFRYKKNVKSLPGKPDIVVPKYRTLIFVNGCFWHGHNCKAAKLPGTNADFWNEKIAGNVLRDSRNKFALKKLGWKVIVIWQCKMNSRKKLEQTIANVSRKL